MLTQTTELAIKTLMFLAHAKGRSPMSPRQIARQLGCSPSYLAKTANILSKAGLLRSVRGINGGVMLAKKPEEIRLREIVEACQGLLVGNYCNEISGRGNDVCSFHEAMQELFQAMVQVLSKWTLADLLRRPVKRSSDNVSAGCRMFYEGFDFHYPSKRKKL